MKLADPTPFLHIIMESPTLILLVVPRNAPRQAEETILVTCTLLLKFIALEKMSKESKRNS